MLCGSTLHARQKRSNACTWEAWFLEDLRRSVPQNGCVYLHIVELCTPLSKQVWNIKEHPSKRDSKLRNVSSHTDTTHMSLEDWSTAFVVTAVGKLSTKRFPFSLHVALPTHATVLAIFDSFSRELFPAIALPIRATGSRNCNGTVDLSQLPNVILR